MRYRTTTTALAAVTILALATGLWAAVAATPTTAPKAATPTAPAKAVTPTAPAKAATPTAPAKGPAADTIMGQYSGNFTRAAGSTDLAEAKVARLPTGGYQIVLLWPEGGKTQRLRWEADVFEGKVEFGGTAAGVDISGSIVDRKLVAEIKGKFAGKFDLAWEAPKAPSEGEVPSEGSVVLLAKAEGAASSTAEWSSDAWKASPDGTLTPGKGPNATKKSFGDCRLHLEFLVPFEPDKAVADRASAGVWLEGRYEIRLLDSFGLDPAMDGCGAITGMKAPRTNACFPPGQWQTLDIVFRAPKVEGGTLYKPGVLTVVQNGTKIHDIVKVEKATTGGAEGPAVESAPLVLQARGQPIRFRNIWLLPLKEGDLGGL